MFYEIMINVLIFSGVLLILAFVVATIQGILILIDLRKTTHEITNKINSLSSLIDVVTIFVAGLGGLRGKINPGSSNFAGFAAGLKRAVQVLFKNDKEEKNG